MARLAAERRTHADIRKLAAILARMDSADDPAKRNKLDADFHIAIAQAGGNPLTVKLIEDLRASWKRIHWRPQQCRTVGAALSPNTARSTRRFFDAIRIKRPWQCRPTSTPSITPSSSLRARPRGQNLLCREKATRRNLREGALKQSFSRSLWNSGEF